MPQPTLSVTAAAPVKGLKTHSEARAKVDIIAFVFFFFKGRLNLTKKSINRKGIVV